MDDAQSTDDYVVYSDGSGHIDGFGGWAAIAQTSDGKHQLFHTGTHSGTSVDRMEMTAMLEGLALVDCLSKQFPSAQRRYGVQSIPRVLIYSDRESMVKSILGEYERSNALDLWARFNYYATKFTISAIHVSRETDFKEFKKVDLHASTGRIIIKNYYESL